MHAASQASLLRVVLGLAAAFVLAVIAAHPAVRRVERRLGLTVLLSSGLPFLAMGVVFRHPSVGILTDDVVSDLRPALEFGLGWLGFVVGMQFDVRELDTMPDKIGTVVFAESALPFAMTALLCTAAFVGLDPQLTFGGAEPLGHQFMVALDRASLRDALALGACAAPAAPVAAVAIARSAGSVPARIVARVTALNDVAGVIVLALICAFFRPTDELSAWKLPHIAWLFVTLGMGGVLGILAYILLRSAHGVAEEVAYLLAAIALSAGMAGYLAISPLVSCCIAGALLTNLPHERLAELKATIVEVERPLYLIFLLVAGALWDPTAWQGWALVPIFVLARVGGKIGGALIAVRTGPKELPDAGTLGLALSPQSPIAIATIVSYATLYKPPADRGAGSVPWLMTAVVGGAVLTELTVQAIARLRGGLKFDLRQHSIVSISPPPAPALPSGTGMGSPPS
jgi:Kef-type K+ transport system membrane component KefB